METISTYGSFWGGVRLIKYAFRGWTLTSTGILEVTLPDDTLLGERVVDEKIGEGDKTTRSYQERSKSIIMLYQKYRKYWLGFSGKIPVEWR